MSPPVEDTNVVRRRMRALRRNLEPEFRRAAQQAIRLHLRKLGIWKRDRRVSTFLSFGGEVDLRGTFADAWSAGAKLYVPLIARRRSGHLSFVPIARETQFRINWYGIEEPASGLKGQKFLREMDVVLVPTLAFDAHGHRLGMGAGYYDRAMQRRLDRSRSWRRPLLVGIAFGLQQVEAIERQPWDVPLDMIVTERGVMRFPTGNPREAST
jgi:5-formyltetrahydrofolate cyclo-ligase